MSTTASFGKATASFGKATAPTTYHTTVDQPIRFVHISENKTPFTQENEIKVRPLEIPTAFYVVADGVAFYHP